MNDDTISRQAAIDALTPIYKSASLRNRNVFSTARKCIAAIEELPSVQPEITRCKDCEHWTNDDCPFAWGKVEDAFCSYAERRTDG